MGQKILEKRAAAHYNCRLLLSPLPPRIQTKLMRKHIFVQEASEFNYQSGLCIKKNRIFHILRKPALENYRKGMKPSLYFFNSIYLTESPAFTSLCEITQNTLSCGHCNINLNALLGKTWPLR